MIPITVAAMLSLWSMRVEDGLAVSSGTPYVFTAIATSPISKTMDVAINRTSRWVKWLWLACRTYRWYNLSSYKCNSLQYRYNNLITSIIDPIFLIAEFNSWGSLNYTVILIEKVYKSLRQ